MLGQASFCAGQNPIPFWYRFARFIPRLDARQCAGLHQVAMPKNAAKMPKITGKVPQFGRRLIVPSNPQVAGAIPAGRNG